MSRLITGILAHVDAGKTTLSEALLYECGAIRKLGRVDSKNAFLDNNAIERERGITVFSKQAVLNQKITLIDTPGHVDFSAEMERTLSVLDCAVLLINASDGVQAHTRTLWSLLEQQNIPTAIFVNKMDMPDSNKAGILNSIKETLSADVVDFTGASVPGAISADADSFYESVASCDDFLTEKFLEGKNPDAEDIRNVVSQRKVFPCLFGSALKLEGISQLIEVLQNYFEPRLAPDAMECETETVCIVYKISRDRQDTRLTHLKILSGKLKVKDYLGEEKVNEIRIYSGDRYESVKEIGAGEICAVTGLKLSRAGTSYGPYPYKFSTKMEPVLVYSVIVPPESDQSKMLQLMRNLEEEIPELKVSYSEETKEIQVMLMGEVQTEVLKQLIRERNNLDIDFGEGKIAYKETIEAPVTGVGHYEPLKHYAEVHLKISPLARGNGIRYVSDLSVDELDENWQRLILTHLHEKNHLGVLTGSPLTDIEYKVTAGRAHLKHTEGGDFREATYRAVRHGLMSAKSILLEPMYRYEITVPQENTGRVMSDIERMSGTFTLTESYGGMSTLTGRCPVSEMKNYATELRAFTKGQGTVSLVTDSYEKCHNQEEVVEQIGYNPEADTANPAGSVFCSHGAGFVVDWKDVDSYKHIKG